MTSYKEDWQLLIGFGSNTDSAAIFMFTAAGPALGLKRTGREVDQALISVYSQGRDCVMLYPYLSLVYLCGMMLVRHRGQLIL
jgi:hypothetical protein